MNFATKLIRDAKYLISVTSYITLLVPIFTLILVLTIPAHLDRSGEDTRSWVSHTLKVQADLTKILSLLQDMETGQRGYILTGDKSYLVPFKRASQRIQNDIVGITKLTSDNQNQQNSIEELVILIENKLSELQNTITIREKEGMSASISVIKTNSGKDTMDQIRTILSKMNAEEEDLLVVRQRNFQDQLFIIRITYAALVILVIGAIIIMFVRLQVAMAAAKKANQSKSEFLANINHELRTPLTATIGSLGLLSSVMSEGLSDQGHELLEIAKRNSETQLRLVNELLDYEKILAGMLKIETSRYDILELSSSVVQNNMGVAYDRNVKFDIVNHPTPLFADVHKSRFEQVLTNLLSNAIKFSDTGSSVKISFADEVGKVIVKVEDYGTGIPKEYWSSIYTPFTQADSSSSRSHSGTGLGLAISKTLTEGMGGSLYFKSKMGSGTTFFAEFPSSA